MVYNAAVMNHLAATVLLLSLYLYTAGCRHSSLPPHQLHIQYIKHMTLSYCIDVSHRGIIALVHAYFISKMTSLIIVIQPTAKLVP